MDRTKILFGNENKNDSNNPTKQEATTNNNNNKVKFTQLKKTGSNSNPILDILANTPNSPNVNKNDLINIIKSCSRTDINLAINNLLSQELSQSEANNGKASSSDTGLESEPSSLTVGNEGSLTSLTSEQAKSIHELNKSQTEVNDHLNSQFTELLDYAESLGIEDDVDKQADNFQSSENFDEHLRVEFDDTASEYSNMASMTQKEYEEEEEVANRSKNDLSLFNELSRENYDITELDDGADLTGMSREVANLIRENSELLQTKHALNVLKDDLIVRLDNFSSEMVLLREELKNLQTIKACLQLRISELEEEAKKSKEELAEKSKKQEEEDESVPISQRKRFTRAEMARVLMERNQYKERLMDLQEAVRWTEMMRANKADPTAVAAHPAVQTASGVPAASVATSAASGADAPAADQTQEKKKDKTPMWKFFSDLFGSSSSSQPAQQVSPSHSASNSTGSSQHTASSANADPTISEKTVKAYEFLKNDNENKSNQAKASDKNNKMVVKEDGRMQAYGWSLPSKSSLTLSGEASKPITVPVPVYCRPLFETDNNLKMSASCTVNFSFDPVCAKNCQELIEASAFSSFRSNLPSGKSYQEFKSSCIWICNLNENDTHVSILDANKPGDLIEQFILKYLKIYCMQSVAGADGSEYPLSVEKLRLMQSNINETNSKLDLNADEINGSGDNSPDKSKDENITFIECESDQDQASFVKNDSPITSSGTESDQTVPTNEQDKLLSSLYPTMWMGSQEGWLLVHSTISNVSKSIEKIKLKDAILSIIQNKGRVIVGLADGSIAIFNRNSEGLWDLKNFHLINVDKPSHSIRCLINVDDNVWAGCRNKIYVLNPDECKLLSTIEVHPRKENQIRHMAWINDGVWVSLRLDSTLRLYHAKTRQHLQYLDIEPFITRMLGSSNIGVSTVRISSLLIGAKRLWLGTGNGVILSLPFNESIKEAVNSTNLSNIPGTGVRVSADPDINDPNSHIPYCNLSEAQFSFHGHRNAIKFFLNVPIEAIQKLKSKDIPKSKEEAYEKVETMLVLSGGHGYIDFRIGDNGKSSLEKRYNEIKNQAVENKAASNKLPSSNKNERSHLIVWQLNNNNS